MTAEPFSCRRMTKAEAFQRACERNALRRESRLPLIPMADAIAEESLRDAIRVFNKAADHYRLVYDDIRSDVLADLRVRRGADFGMSAGGRWLIDWRAHQAFVSFLRTQGFERPGTFAARYGSSRPARAGGHERSGSSAVPD